MKSIPRTRRLLRKVSLSIKTKLFKFPYKLSKRYLPADILALENSDASQRSIEENTEVTVRSDRKETSRISRGTGTATSTGNGSVVDNYRRG